MIERRRWEEIEDDIGECTLSRSDDIGSDRENICTVKSALVCNKDYIASFALIKFIYMPYSFTSFLLK